MQLRHPGHLQLAVTRVNDLGTQSEAFGVLRLWLRMGLGLATKCTVAFRQETFVESCTTPLTSCGRLSEVAGTTMKLSVDSYPNWPKVDTMSKIIPPSRYPEGA